MGRLYINGGKNLHGNINVSGSKNLALCLLFGALLNNKKVTLKNIPNIKDINTTLSIFDNVGVDYIRNKNTITFNSSIPHYQNLIMPMISTFRASYYFIGLFLGLFKKCVITYPGGCNFEKRPINYHIDAFKAMGVDIKEEDNILTLKSNITKSSRVDVHHSFGASINVLLYASTLSNTTIIENIALEPEVTVFIKFLKVIGVNIYKLNNSSYSITKGEFNKEIVFNNIYDRIEAGTYSLLSLMNHNSLKINHYPLKYLSSLHTIYNLLKVNYKYYKNSITLSKFDNVNNLYVIADRYPYFPTDLQPQLTATLSDFDNVFIIEDRIYTSRFSHVEGLNKLGANIIQYDNLLIINNNNTLSKNDNVTTLNSDITLSTFDNVDIEEKKRSLSNFDNVAIKVVGKDLRCVASLLMKCLSTKGLFIIEDFDYIFRGYEDIIAKLKNMGADIYYEE